MVNTLDEILIERADAFAALAHKDHFRSNKTHDPYIEHLREVASLVRGSGGTTEEICAALLHDSVEDTATTLEDIETEFGSVIKDIVKELTDDPESEKLPTLERKKLQAEHAKVVNSTVRRVKLADQISNVRYVVEAPSIKWDKQKCIDYVTGAYLIANECSGISVFLDQKFNEVCAKAETTYGFSVKD